MKIVFGGKLRKNWGVTPSLLYERRNLFTRGLNLRHSARYDYTTTSAAHAMGLGAVWKSVYPEARKVKGVSEALRLPRNLIPLNCILIGYPAENHQPLDKWDEEKITCWQTE